MKDPIEVLRAKELEIVKVRKEVDALRIAARLLSDDSDQPEQKQDLRQLVEMP
jgi:hypothetical protein